MTEYRITDPAIKADYGTFQAPSQGIALDRFAQRMGWDDYADYLRVGARFTGLRTLSAEPVAVLAEAA